MVKVSQLRQDATSIAESTVYKEGSPIASSEPEQTVPEVLKRDENTAKTFCSVCGDEANGKHYGINCCDGCRGFFKRAYMPGQFYVCRFGNSCKIDAANRNYCRACRLRKCLAVGLRVPLSRDVDDTEDCPVPQRNNDADLLSAAYRYFLEADCIYLFQPAHQLGNDYQNLNTIQDLRDAYKQSVDSFVRWARETSMSALLGMSDSVALAEASAAERFIIDICFRSQDNDYFDVGCSFLFKKSGQTLTPDDQLSVFFASLSSTMTLINDLIVTDREFSYLRALSYLNKTVKNLQSRDKVANLRSHFLRILERELDEHAHGLARFSKLNLILRRTVVLSRKLSELFSGIATRVDTPMIE